MYVDLMDSGPILRRKDIWKTKIPSMTKVFMWFLQREVVLTKDNLAKRNWHGSKKYCFVIRRRQFIILFSVMPVYYIDLAYGSCYIQFSNTNEYFKYVWKLIRWNSS